MDSGETIETVGLEPFPCEEGLWDWDWFTWEEAQLQGYPAAALVPMVGAEMKTQPGSSQQSVAKKLGLAMKTKLFSIRTA